MEVEAAIRLGSAANREHSCGFTESAAPSTPAPCTAPRSYGGRCVLFFGGSKNSRAGAAPGLPVQLLPNAALRFAGVVRSSGTAHFRLPRVRPFPLSGLPCVEKGTSKQVAAGRRDERRSAARWPGQARRRMAAAMAAAERYCVAEERSGHCAVVDGNFLYVWGGYVSIEDNEVYLPNDEIWIYEIDNGLWTMHLMEGELPTSMSGSCGACINGKLYIFGGYDDKGYSNRLYFVNLRTRDGTFQWEKIIDFKGQPPTPRDKLSCWVYKDRLIYFGGYGCRKHSELQDCFDVHDASWEGQIFWGWHNDVHVFDTNTQTWFQPEIKNGIPPQPRAAHTCAVLGNKGYIFGGRVLQTRMNDLHCLNLDTWTWSGRIHTNGEKPKHRSWHTLTPIADDQLFLFGGLSAENIPLSDGWIHNVITNGWRQLTHLPKTRPRLWHTACLGKENEVMVFGGSKDDLLFMDTGHCNDLLIFQTQPYSLLRLCLDCIGKNAIILESEITLLPPKLLQQVLKKITFWTAANHRQEQRAKTEETDRYF